ncbi:MAG: hypothetical protein ACTSUE_07515 [Promethearchaeota archaeon]
MTGIKLIKTIPGIDLGTFEKVLHCDKFWEACIDLPKVSVSKTGDGTMHWELMAHFLLDPLGVAKIPIEVKHDLHFKQDLTFKGEGKKYLFWATNSNAVESSQGELFFKTSGRDTKIMLEVTSIQLKAGFLDIAGLGKSLVMNRFKQEMQNLVMKLIDLAGDGQVDEILKSC